MRHFRFAPPLVALSLLACSGGTSGDGPGQAGADGDGSPDRGLILEVTDAPFVHSIVEEALLRVDEIRVHEAGDEAEDDDGWVTLYQGEPRAFDLAELQNGVTSVLVHADLAPGSYDQVRLRIHSGRLVLVDGDVFSTDDGSLHLTSTDESGLKIFVDPPVEVVEEEARRLLLDFDMTRTFLPVPPVDPLDANKYLLHPVIRAASLKGSGRIDGRVVRDDLATPVDAATVYLLPEGADVGDSVASTASGTDGRFAVLGLEAGVYDLVATKGELTDTVFALEVSAGETAEVQIVVE